MYKNKKISCILLLIALSTTIIAQTQQGYVRTIGRSGKPGQPVSGVIIRADGPYNAVVTDASGQFILMLDGLNYGDGYRLSTVRKSGYRLVDASVVGRTYALSGKVRLEIVIVSEAQIAQEKAAIEQKLLIKMEESFHSKLSSLQQQLDSQKLAADAYRIEYEALCAQRDRYDQLIDQMAERYALTDYDRLDSLDQIINAHIENGELEEAERLIKSKGNIHERKLELLESERKAQELAEKADSLASVIEEKRLLINHKKKKITKHK